MSAKKAKSREKGLTRVLIADDHMVFRSGLRMALETQEDFHVVTEACSGEEAIEAALRHKPHVILMDVEMPGMDGIEATRCIREKEPEIQVVALSGHETDDKIHGMLEAGALGYVDKRASASEIHTAVRKAARGRVYFSEDILETVYEGYVRAMPKLPAKNAVPYGLSHQQLKILSFLVAGWSDQKIANYLGTANSTVRSHIHRVLKKTGTSTRNELIKLARKENLTPSARPS